MKYSIKCTICNQVKSVNGQKQISEFVGQHKGHPELTFTQKLTCNFIDVNNPEDRINLKIDPKPLVTHGHYNSNDRYLNDL
jgi:hypothetical protein